MKYMRESFYLESIEATNDAMPVWTVFAIKVILDVLRYLIFDL